MPSEADTLIRARGLALGYGGSPIVEGIELEVRAGEVWFLIGPNGSGKTTLLRAVLGLVAPRRRRALAPCRRRRSRPRRLRAAALRVEPPRSRRRCASSSSLGLVGAGVRRGERARAPRLGARARRSRQRSRRATSARSPAGSASARWWRAHWCGARACCCSTSRPRSSTSSPRRASSTPSPSSCASQGTTLLFVTHELELAAKCATHVALFSNHRVTVGPRDEVLADGALERAFGDHGRIGRHV